MAKSASSSSQRRRSKTAPPTVFKKKHVPTIKRATAAAAAATAAMSSSSSKEVRAMPGPEPGPRQWGLKGIAGGKKRKALAAAGAPGAAPSPAKVKRTVAAAAAATSAAPTVSSTSSSTSALPPEPKLPPNVANIRVAVRVRPENEAESSGGHRRVVEVVDERMLVFDPKDDSDDFFYNGRRQNRRDVSKKARKDHKFAFDVVFGPDSTNEDVYQHTTRDLIDVLFCGYNCSVFVYGATGAGKTHTMLGSPKNPGLTFKTVMELYSRMESVSAHTACEVAVSYVEIYNETVVDLINPGRQLAIREDGSNGVAIPGLSIHRPADADSLLQFLVTGNANRTQHPTDANAESSRSHAVFQVYLKQRSRDAGLSADVKVAKLSMIDLAGSERASVAHSRGGARLREGANINKSLLALGSVINALAEGSRHIPYRNSKLTRMLKDSIGGNCRTVMISNVSPSAATFDDTYNTLKYADRAKRIKIKLKKNVHSVDFHVGQYAKIVETIKSELEEWKAKAGRIEKEAETLREENQRLREELEETRQLQATSESNLTHAHNSVQGDSAYTSADLDQTYDMTAQPAHDANTNHDEDQLQELRSEVAFLKAKLTAAETRNKELETDKFHPEQDEEQLQSLEAEEEDSVIGDDIKDLITMQKRLVEDCQKEKGNLTKLDLKKEYAKKNLERSALVAVGDPAASSAKIRKQIQILEQKKHKAAKRLKKQLKNLIETEKVIQERFELLEDDAKNSENPNYRLRLVRSEIGQVKTEVAEHEQSCMKEAFALTLALAHSEHSKVEELLKLSLPQLRNSVLLLSSYGSFEKENQQFKDLSAFINGTSVRFNDHRLVDTDHDTTADRMGPVLAEGSDLALPRIIVNGHSEVPMEEEESSVNATFSLASSSSSAASSLPLESSDVTSSSVCDSTFVLEEEQGTTSEQTAPADSTFVREEDTTTAQAEQLPEEAWRPPTPPKKVPKQAAAAPEIGPLSYRAPLKPKNSAS